MAEATITDFRYTSSRPVTDVRVQYCNNRPIVGTRNTFSGFLIPIDQDSALDDILEAVGHSQLEIKHQKGTQRHWAFDKMDAFVLALGIPESSQPASKREGAAYGWAKIKDQNGSERNQSRIMFRMFPRVLLEVGYELPVLFGVKSTSTRDVQEVMKDHFRVLNAAALEAKENKKPVSNLPFYAFSMEFGPANKTVSRGTAASSDVVPIVSFVPKAIDREYLKVHHIKRSVPGLVDLVESYMEETIQWSRTTSMKIAAGTVDDGTEGPSETPETEPF